MNEDGFGPGQRLLGLHVGSCVSMMSPHVMGSWSSSPSQVCSIFGGHGGKSSRSSDFEDGCLQRRSPPGTEGGKEGGKISELMRLA